MWFLIKGTFWFSMVLVALSFFGGDDTAESNAMPAFQVTDAVQAASGAYQYLAGLCLERPDVCEKGAETLTALGHRAREGAKVAFDILDKQLGGTGTGTGSDGEPLELDLPMRAAETTLSENEAIVTGTVSSQAGSEDGVPLPRVKPVTR